MISGIHHVAISSPDIENLEKFYCEQFGFRRVSSFDWKDNDQDAALILQVKRSSGKAVIIKLGGIALELLEFHEPESRRKSEDWSVVDHGLTHMCFEVDDCQAEYSRLKAAGMEFHCVPQDDPDGGSYVYGRDPDGNVVEMWQLADQKE